MEDYGFVLITDEEASQMNLPGGSGLFSELYTSMQNELKMNPKKSADYKKAPYMSPEEKRVSFLNRYFVFKKVRNVDVQKMSDVIKNQRKIDDKRDEEIVEEIKETVEEKEKKELVRRTEEKPGERNWKKHRQKPQYSYRFYPCPRSRIFSRFFCGPLCNGTSRGARRRVCS